MLRLVIELILFLGGGWFVASQIAWPLVAKKPLLMSFRSKAAMALHEAEQQRREAVLKLEAAQLEADTNRIRQKAEAVALADYNKLTDKERS